MPDQVVRKFRTGLVQIPVKLGDRGINQQTVEAWMKKYYVPSDCATALVLPELWDVGYALDSIPQLADKNAEQAVEFLGKLARQYGCWFVNGSVATEDNGRYYNRSLIVNRQGELVAHYDKAHLVPFITVEDGVFEMGDSLCIFEMDGIKLGSIICYDIRFPEWVRLYALAGVEALFICSQWTRARMDLFRTMIRAHAIENMFYTVAVNNCDFSGEIDFGGESFICAPTGEVVAECSGTQDGIFAEIDVTNINENREFLKVFEKRRPALYKGLFEAQPVPPVR